MLPSTLKYSGKIESAAAKSYRVNLAAQNGTGPYNPGEMIYINIPTQNNLCLCPAESYLKFRVNLTNVGTLAANYARWDAAGAHGAIQRIRCFHQSNLVSDIDNYAQLAKILMDAQMSTDSTYGKYSILAGTRNDLVTNATGSCLQVKSGRRINGTTPIAVGGVVTDTYCLNLISLVGTLCTEKYLPLWALTSSSLRVEIQLVSSASKCITSDQVLAMTVDNVEYIANMIEISDQSVDIIKNSLNGQPLQFTIGDYKNYQTSLNVPANNSQATIPIAAKFSSLKALFVTQQDSSKPGTLTYFPLSSNVFNLSSYYFRIGPNVVPSKAPETLVEMYAESVKAIGSMSSLLHQPSIEIDSYTANLPVACTDAAATNGTTGSGAFVIGLDTENYVNSNKDAIFAGLNTNTVDTYFNPSYTGLAAATTITYNTFAHFDSVLVFDNNTMYIKF